ncbi:MAG: Ig-like domain-containing protein [Gammaproteobacteria bacterium]|nr:Ig-like domain-containing protein [Gammaproteobacteria bacterium]
MRFPFNAAGAIAAALLVGCGNNSPDLVTNGNGPITPPVVPPGNTAPTAVDDTLNINMNAPRNTVAVLDNDSDLEDALTLQSVEQTSANGGKVRLSDSGDSVIYEPPLNYTGNDSVNYTISDGFQTATATINVTVAQHLIGTRPCELEAGARIADGRPYCFDVLIPAADGHNIGATVFVPADAGASRPSTIIHAHGFGESRFADLENPNAFMINRVTAQSLLELWHEGYWVISYDQRGFGAHTLWGPQTESAFTSGEISCVAPDDPNCIDILSPEREARDLVDVIDWMIANLREGFSVTAANSNTTFNAPPANADPLFAEDSPNDPILGTIGLSYGGGFQTMGTAADGVINSGNTRVNTIVPVTTWYDIRYSLAPSDIPKTGWIQFLTVATTLGTITPSPTGDLATMGLEALVADNISDNSYNTLYTRTPRSYCENMGDDSFATDPDLSPAIGTGSIPNNPPSVFMIQGQRDLLFNYNEAVDLARCYDDAGSPDVRVLIQTEGHILPAAQPASYRGMQEVIYVDETIYCDSQGTTAISTRELISGWFREKLGVIDTSVSPLNANAMPTVCTTHFETGAAPITGNSFNSLDDIITGDATNGTYTFTLDSDENTAGAQDVTFNIPNPPGNSLYDQTLLTASSTLDISGIPLMDLSISANGTPDLAGLIDDPRFFVSLGVVRNGDTAFNVIADQITPVSGNPPNLAACGLAGCISDYTFPRTDAHYPEQVGETTGRMSGFSVKLNAGDQLVFRITGAEALYNLHNTTPGGYAITLSGTVEIPVLQPNG